MKVIGIDPGYDRMGVAVLEKIDGKETCLFSTCVETEKTETIAERLAQLGNELTDIIATHHPTVLAIETIFFNKNIKTAIAVAEARGVILYLAASHHLPVFEYSPQQIKVAATGYGASNKDAVTDMVKKFVNNIPDQALDDEYDAIAVALTCLVSERLSPNPA